MKQFHAASALSIRKGIPLAGCLWLAFFAATSLAQNPVTVSPPSRTQRVGDHLAFLAVASGTQPVAWQWQLNGTNLSGQTASSLSLSNIQFSNSGTYSVLATLTNGPAPAATATLIVSNGFLPLAATNLVVARVGDGLQLLNTTSGNTLYLDQLATNGNYVSTVMIPDSGAAALIVEGGGATVGLDGSVLTLSSNQQYLNFAGYNQSLPNGGVAFTGSSLPRAIGAVNGLGYYVLCLTNNGLYNGGSGQIRGAVSIDGTVNTFWTAGVAAAASSSIKILTANQGNSGIPSSGAGNDPRVMAIFGGNLWVSSGNNNAGQTQGLYSFRGLPSGSPASTAVLDVSTGAASDPNDFSFSPDGLTVYIADSDNFTTSSGVGGIERWDYNGSTWIFNYSLGTGTGNWGARGLTVNYSHFPGGGSSSRSAVIDATTAEPSTNRLIQITDTSGPGSPSTVLAAAGANQLFRGVRFGPASQPAAALESKMDEANVAYYGATGDGVTDDTQAFKNAIASTLSGSAHNGIYVPMGRFVISGTLTLNEIEMVGKFAGGWPADTMPMPTLLMRVTNAPGLILSNGASLHGIAILYDQGTPATSNAPAISLQGIGSSISSVRIQNPYDGINTPGNATPGRARLSDIYIVSPAHVGVQISKCYDFVQYNHIEVRCANAMSAGAAFVFGRVDEGSFTGLLASNCLTGLEFDHDSSVNPAGGNFTGSFAGCSTMACANGVTITGPHKVKISGGDFSDLNYGTVINGATEVTLIGGQWQTANDQAVQIVSASNVIIDDSMFSRPAAVAAPLVTANNCTTFTLNHSQFLPGSTGLVLNAGVARAVMIGNSFEDGGVSNLMTSGKFIIGTSLLTASPPSGLVAMAGSDQVTLSWGISVQATNYEVKRSLTSGGSYATIASPSGPGYTDTSLTNGVTYYYVVSALRPSGQSANSSEASATPQAPDVSVNLSPGGNQFILSWPGWASNFAVYMTTNLSPPAVWVPLTNAAQSNNGFFNLTLPTTTNGREFFQLGPP
jgi:hypothetical protein